MNREKAEKLFRKQSEHHFGSWAIHSVNVAKAAEAIAEACYMDKEAAYCMGLLHDIGRSLTRGQFLHIARGYEYMEELGEEKIARICLTHSFPVQSIDSYVGKMDIDKVQHKKYQQLLIHENYDYYDRLIQLCDIISTEHGFVLPEKKLTHLIIKYGCNRYTALKWKSTFALKESFDEAIGKDVLTYLHALYPDLTHC